jgi:hypothetical protein
MALVDAMIVEGPPRGLATKSETVLETSPRHESPETAMSLRHMRTYGRTRPGTPWIDTPMLTQVPEASPKRGRTVCLWSSDEESDGEPSAAAATPTRRGHEPFDPNPNTAKRARADKRAIKRGRAPARAGLRRSPRFAASA